MTIMLPSQLRLRIDRLFRKLAIIACLCLACPTVSWAGCVVNDNSDASLRAAMVGAGTVTLSFDGVITLTNSIDVTADTIVDGSGHNITISGGNAVRLFNVNSGVQAAFLVLTLANGGPAGSPGGTNS